MNQKQYINEIIQRSCLPRAEHKRLRNDLNNEIITKLERGESIEQIITHMGDPDKIAAEIYENHLETTKRPFREYKSKKILFGLPLVHIIRPSYALSVPHTRIASVRIGNAGGRYNSLGLPTARGIFAFGPKAKGFFAVGNLSSGFISIGNLSVGILSIGNLSVGLLSIGNIALALIAVFGNLALGLISAGNTALGYSAAGNLAYGVFAIGNKTAGTYTYTISDLSLQFDEIKIFITRLSAPAPIKVFYKIVERFLGLLIDTYSAMPIFIIFSIALLGTILLLSIIPMTLLKKATKEKHI